MVRPTRCGWSLHPPSSRTRSVGNTLACLLLLPLRTKGLLRTTTTAAPTSSARPQARSTWSRNYGSRRTRRDAMTAVHGDGDDTALRRSAPPPSVCVIGAGAAGLAAGRCLRDEGCRVTVLEKSHDVGGVWRYKPEPEARAPMYRSLVTNLPKETMSYFGFPFPEENQSFSSHAQVLDYLCSYADEHDLHPLISLGCSVESVRLASLPSVGDSSHTFGSVDGSLSSSEDSSLGEEAVTGTDTAAAAGRQGGGIYQGQSNAGVESTTLGRWEVVYRRRSAPAAAAVAGDDDRVVAEVFDAVCVCSGHFDETYTPTVEGLDEFQGTVMHAREYDIPGVEAFVGKRVLCVGARSSGTDIAREVSSVAHAVHVCDRSNPVTSKGGERGNVWWRTALEKFEGANGVRFKNGELLEVDTVVWCTGYNYAFPFLEGSGLLTAPASKRVHPLFEHLFHVYHPSLSFIGLPQSIVTFPLFELQANAVAAAIVGRASFPSLAEREQWLRGEEDRLREGGVGPSSRGAHVLGGRQWEYLRRLLRIASGPGVLGRGSTAENHASRRGGGGGGGGDEGSAIPKASSKEASPSRGAAAATGGGAQQRHQLELERLLKVLNVKEAIYNDAGDNRPRFPGGPDDYRRRQYRVDWDNGKFSVSYADRKANGEGPSSPAAS